MNSAATLAALTLFVLFAGVAPAQDGSQVPPPDGLRPDTVLQPGDGPAIAVFHVGSSEVVSIRVSVPLTETAEEAGAGQLLRIQARDRMESLASRIGARVEVHRTAGALVYQVSGSVQDADFLGWILKEGMGPPQSSRFDAAVREARVELQRQLETPEGTLARRLVQGLSPGTSPLQGTEGILDRMDPSRLSAIWARSHVRQDARVVVVGRLDVPLILAAISDLGLPQEGPTPQFPPLQMTGESLGAPEIIRHWTARAFSLPDGGAVGLIASRHLSLLLQESPGDYEASVELWEVGRNRALVLSGAAYPRSRQSLQNRLQGLLQEGLERLDETRVQWLAAELETEVRLAARYPWRLAELAGQAWDTGRGPGGVADLVQELRGATAGEIQAFLQELQATEPVVEELRP